MGGPVRPLGSMKMGLRIPMLHSHLTCLLVLKQALLRLPGWCSLDSCESCQLNLGVDQTSGQRPLENVGLSAHPSRLHYALFGA